MPTDLNGAAITPSAPCIINSAGEYRLTSPISGAFSAGGAILIRAGDVSLDCQGLAIHNSLTPDQSATLARAIYMDTTAFTNVTVKNVHARGFLDSINLRGHGIEVEDVTGWSWHSAVFVESGGSSFVRRVRTVWTGGTTAEGFNERSFAVHQGTDYALTEDCVLHETVGNAEGVGISHTGLFSTIRRNWLGNKELREDSFGVWLSTPARSTVHDNVLLNWETGIAAPTDTAAFAANNRFANVTTPELGNVTGF